MGCAFDQVMQAPLQRVLREADPARRVRILGQGTSQRWWYRDNTSVTAGREAVADQYYRAALGYGYSVGGVFWWYYADDIPADPVLGRKVSAAGDTVTGSPTPCRRAVHPAGDSGCATSGR